MKFFLTVSALLIFSQIAPASQYRQLKLYSQSSLSADDSKIKSCLKSLYASQVQFRKSKGYFATLPAELKLTRYKVCEGLEISTHLVTEDKFKMTATFNHKTWSVDQNQNIRPQEQLQD
jgi:hypothetical protein